MLAVKLALGWSEALGIQPPGVSWAASHWADAWATAAWGKVGTVRDVRSGGGPGRAREDDGQGEAEGDARNQQAGEAVHGGSLSGSEPGSDPSSEHDDG